MTATEYLRRMEWTTCMRFGGWVKRDGQCPECCGLAPDEHWLSRFEPKDLGHEPGCDLAESLAGLGEEVVYKGDVITLEMSEATQVAREHVEAIGAVMAERMDKSFYEQLTGEKVV